MQGHDLVNAFISNLEKEVIWKVARFNEYKLELFSLQKFSCFLNGKLIKWQIKFCINAKHMLRSHS